MSTGPATSPTRASPKCTAVDDAVSWGPPVAPESRAPAAATTTAAAGWAPVTDAEPATARIETAARPARRSDAGPVGGRPRAELGAASPAVGPWCLRVRDVAYMAVIPGASKSQGGSP